MPGTVWARAKDLPARTTHPAIINEEPDSENGEQGLPGQSISGCPEKQLVYNTNKPIIHHKGLYVNRVSAGRCTEGDGNPVKVHSEYDLKE